MFDQSDPSIIWVAPSADPDGSGMFDAPFQTVDRALSVVRPGGTIVLKPGVYSRTVTVEVSGTLHEPIRIAGEPGAEVRGANWFFYDASNLIVSGFTFRSVENVAISVIGACEHNRFEALSFFDCGMGRDSSCTMFFGGSGGACNIVEGCRFERGTGAMSPGGPSIALMVAEGDGDAGAAIVDHLFRKNLFVNYTSAIVVGAGDSPGGQYGHIVEYNTLDRCAGDALIVKCGDTLVRGNLIRECAGTAIAVRSGSNSVVEANRLLDAAQGICVVGDGHTVGNNCLVRCRDQGIIAVGEQDGGATRNLFIENNTIIDCGSGASVGAAAHSGIRCGKATSGIIRKNLFFGSCRVAVAEATPSFLVVDNGAAGSVEAQDGVAVVAVAFRDQAGDDYSNDSGYGAIGWPLTPPGFDPHGDDVDPENGYVAAGEDGERDDGPNRNDPAGEDGEDDFASFMERLYNGKLPEDGEGDDS